MCFVVCCVSVYVRDSNYNYPGDERAELLGLHYSRIQAFTVYMESTFDIIAWSNRQEESLRALFATFDLNDDGLLDVGELRGLLSLIHQNTEDEENHVKLTTGQQKLLQGSIETITTFSMTSGITFSEFVIFYNSMQEIGMQLRNMNTDAEETQADELIDDITEAAVKTSVNLLDKPLLKRSASEKDKFLAVVEERRKFLHRQITKNETRHHDLVPNHNRRKSTDNIDYNFCRICRRFTSFP